MSTETVAREDTKDKNDEYQPALFDYEEPEDRLFNKQLGSCAASLCKYRPTRSGALHPGCPLDQVRQPYGNKRQQLMIARSCFSAVKKLDDFGQLQHAQNALK